MELFAVILFKVFLVGVVGAFCTMIFDLIFDFRYTRYADPVLRASICMVLIPIVIGAIALVLL